MVAGEAEAEAWLGGEATIGGNAVSLPDRVQEYLLAGFKVDVWTLDDIPEEDSTLEGPELASQVRLWKAVLVDCAKIAKVDHRSSEDNRFERWFAAQYSMVDDAQGVGGGMRRSC